MADASRDEGPIDLEISSEKVCFIIVKARAFDAKVEPVEPDPGSNPVDTGEREVLEDYEDDATAAELQETIEGLNEDETVDLIALVWVGRGDYGRSEWEDARALARERHRGSAADYLMGIPTLGDVLEEGFATLGHSCEEFELDRL
jgi:hypothetical protein